MAGKSKKSKSVFDRMITELSEHKSDGYLEESMKQDASVLSNIPRRYRLIAMGFVKQYNLDEVNELLLERGCEKLYARSSLEAEFIYAFSNGLSYERWKEMHNHLAESGDIGAPPVGILNGKNLCMGTLRDYILLGSDKSGELNTLHLTRALEKNIASLPSDEANFAAFLRNNISQFSEVREKARYYFCKYLYAYLQCRVSQCLKAAVNKEQNKAEWEDAVSEMAVLRGLTALKRKNMTPVEMKKFLYTAPLSCGGVYDAFNYYYFDYVSCDWMQVLLEYFGEPAMLPADKKKELADAIRAYRPEWEQFDDEAVIGLKYEEYEREEELLDDAYSLSGSSRGYQRNRRGEKSIRSYITGALDIDRTTLIFYLIFFDRCSNYESERIPVPPITEDRLNQILSACGFSQLNPDDDVDGFVLEYLQLEDPVDFLMESVTESALAQKNFYLYHMYNSSVSNVSQLGKLL